MEQSWSHDLVKLVGTAGLDVALTGEVRGNPTFVKNWDFVKDWNESKRYILSISAADATNLIGAIDDPADGVLPWLTHHW